ncbi:MAG: excinuclease ABC subunit C [Deltaproteobacteria bacterium CG1_02_45_11]|nr:MAG: excinuclease ABC subunit C [Deltaproteobacteria bacterium CG1_02_45_11]
MSESLHEKVSQVSSEPGVYLMKDAEGEVLYVGKAANLKNRLASYFTRTEQSDMKTEILVKKISTFETIITRTEKEALILESNLIKRYKPRYNVILKDDKRYPSLRLDTSRPYPNLAIVRKMKKDGALYFGPFASATAVRQTLKIISKTFKLRKCKSRDFKSRTRPCLNYQMGACLGPCCLDVDKERYNEIVREVILFLKGRTPDLIQKIKQEMMAAARLQDYEKAATLRDKLFAIEKTLEKQVAITTDFKDRDVIGIARSAETSLITLLFIRQGYLVETRYFNFSETLSNDAEMIGTFIRQYYEKTPFLPKEVLVPIFLEDIPLLEELLHTIKGQPVSILWPQRGEKVRLVKMAGQNAENSLKNLIASMTIDMNILVRLRQSLKMDRTPLRIECIDNSNLSGAEAVASMVVFDKGRPDKASYRKYRIKTVREPNDYAYMAEVLKRRYGKSEKSKPYPDLLMVDGGRGQVNIAVTVLKELNLEEKFAIIGIAKKDEKKVETNDKIYKPGRANPVNLGRAGDLLLFLQKIRDEAHRFAISFHRQRRRAALISSALDTIPGIGKKRKQTLLKHFGSIQKIRAAKPDELRTLPGMNRKAAEAVQKALADYS